MTKEQHIEKFKKIHGDKYDYSLTVYINQRTKIKIICPKHGVFEQFPYNHLKQGCPFCAGVNKKTIEHFIKESNEKHNNKYDYSLVNYKNAHTKIKIICPKHGIFEQKPNDHLQGHGCNKCVKDSSRLTLFDFVSKSISKHNNKYDYSYVNYINNKTKVKILCNFHNEFFLQTPKNHIRGQGCPLCRNLNRRIKRLNDIQKCIDNNNQLMPNFNKTACKIFDKISLKENIHIQHAMNGGEHYIKELGYWLDGYDKENNVVYEFDEKHHFDKNGNLSEKDIIRQKEIERFLGCKFIRIKYPKGQK